MWAGAGGCEQSTVTSTVLTTRAESAQKVVGGRHVRTPNTDAWSGPLGVACWVLDTSLVSDGL